MNKLLCGVEDGIGWELLHSRKGGVPVIIWLASYPRSGNTLLRLVLKHCFEVESYSLYSDHEFQSRKVQELVGERPVGPDPNAFLRKLQQHGHMACVKTHELPGADTHRSIYVVRDGRAALVSHYHYFREVLGLHATLEELIAGAYFPSWSTHVRDWMLSGRPNVLPVHFEALVNGESETLDAIGSFLGKKRDKNFSMPFVDLQALMPTFFRSGSNRRNIAEMNEKHFALFDRIYGEVSRAIGYASGSAEFIGVSSRAG